MASLPDAAAPACPRCGVAVAYRNGRMRGRQRWGCAACRRSFGATTGTPLHRLKAPPDEVARALLVVLRRGSLRAAEDVTGHKYETIGRWLRLAGAHAEALTGALVHDLRLTEVEVDEFWSFVRRKGGLPRRAAPPRRPGASAGAACARTARAASWSPGRPGRARRCSRRRWCAPRASAPPTGPASGGSATAGPP